MEVLSKALASRVANLRTTTRVTGIDPDARTIRLTGPSAEVDETYRTCVATLPLPKLLGMTRGAPKELVDATTRLRSNKVWSVAICLDGVAPIHTGHWRYYADETLCFTRLVFMHVFDSGSVPEGCWSVMAEIPQPAEASDMPVDALIARVISDAKRVCAIPRGQGVLAARAWCVDPAYVVFDNETADVASASRKWLETRDIHLLGRYGRWEYSSMSQVMRDGFALGVRLGQRC
jgi:hypothetical protein